MQPLERDLKLTHLRLIAAIADHRQLGLAAEELGMTQPAASRMLAEIERIAGVKICERHARGMSFTLIGRVLERRARSILLVMRDLSREVEELGSGLGGVARVGAVTGPAVGYLTPAIQQLKAASPEAEVHVSVGPSDPLMRDLVAGTIDFALARIPPDLDPHQFDIQRAQEETIDLMVREGHPLSSARSVSIAELSAYEWVMQSGGMPIRQGVEQAFFEAGSEPPRKVVNTTSLLVTMALLTSSTAITPLAREVTDLLIKRLGARLVALPLKETIRVTPYYVVVVKDRPMSPLANRLRALVLSELALENRPELMAKRS